VNDNEIEQYLQAKGLTAPRITPVGIESKIAAEFFFTADDGAKSAPYENQVRHTDDVMQPTLARLTFCVLVLKNGFSVTGESA